MTYVVKHRGPTRPVPKEFRCPVHGAFTADADRDAESAPCDRPRDLRPEVTAREAQARIARGDYSGIMPCGIESPWDPRKVPAIRMRRVEAVRGKHEVAEHKGWLDSTNLEEGQDPEDFAADREKIHEELRKERVMELVRSDR